MSGPCQSQCLGWKWSRVSQKGRQTPTWQVCTISISDSAGNKELWRGARSTLAMVSRRKNSGVTSDLIPWCLQRCNSSTTSDALDHRQNEHKAPFKPITQAGLSGWCHYWNHTKNHARVTTVRLGWNRQFITTHIWVSAPWRHSCTHHHCHGHAIAVIRIFVSAVERGIVLASKNADCHLLELVLMGAHFWSRFSVYNKIASTIYCSQSAFGIWSHSR